MKPLCILPLLMCIVGSCFLINDSSPDSVSLRQEIIAAWSVVTLYDLLEIRDTDSTRGHSDTANFDSAYIVYEFTEDTLHTYYKDYEYSLDSNCYMAWARAYSMTDNGIIGFDSNWTVEAGSYGYRESVEMRGDTLLYRYIEWQDSPTYFRDYQRTYKFLRHTGGVPPNDWPSIECHTLAGP